MAADRHGRNLRVGDIVNIPCTITGVDAHAEFINLAVETVEPMFPGDKKSSWILNAKQVELAQSLGDSAVNVDVATAIEQQVKDDAPRP